MKNPAIIGAIIVALITGVLGPMGVEWIQQEQAQAKVEQGIIDTETLMGHSLFTHADTWVDLIIPQTQASPDAKLFLDIKFRAFQESLEDLVRHTDFDSLTNEQFHAVASKNLNDTVVSYIADARRQGISDEFISSFNQWHQQVVDILVGAIEDNVYSPIHSSQNAKMYAILTAYDSALGATLEDVARTLEGTE
jgi:hypothetical protein